MAKKKISAKRVKKENYWVRLQKVAGEYKNVLFIDADNVSSKQILKIRARLRTMGGYMIMGKNVSVIPSHLWFLLIFSREPHRKKPRSFFLFFVLIALDLDEGCFDRC